MAKSLQLILKITVTVCTYFHVLLKSLHAAIHLECTEHHLHKSGNAEYANLCWVAKLTSKLVMEKLKKF